ncbi:MAG: acetyl-CoA carboxylase biotin carboxyl carrier protein subunit [Dehalococcoidia bacterium]
MKTNKNQQQLRVKIRDVWYLVEILDIDSNPAKVLVDGVPVDVKIQEKPKVQKIENISQKNEPENNLHSGKKQFKSPMPGTIISFAIKEGDTIITGDEVCILEAMKMQQSLKAELSGIVKKVNFQPGAQVATNDILVELE